MPRAALIVTITCLVTALSAQTPTSAPAPERFEVASVKPSSVRPSNGRVTVSEGRGQFGIVRVVSGGSGLEMINGTVLALIRYAYPTMSGEVVGPDWLATDRFDVRAKAARPATRSALEAMTRELLADRFALRARRDVVDRPIYKLVMARADGTPGPRLKRTILNCVEMRAARAKGELGPPTPARPTCSSTFAPGNLTALGISMDVLARLISADAGRMVVDATGLEGDFEFELSWNPRPLSDLPAERPTLFSAVGEQLGLRLHSDHGAVQIVVVDRVERPTPD